MRLRYLMIPLLIWGLFTAHMAHAEWEEPELRQYAMITNATYKLPHYLLEAVCEQESRYRLGQVSNKGAIGVCQILPNTVKLVNGNKDPYLGVGQQNYYFGSKGATVSRIQAVLGVTPDGVFGKITRQAVIEFQMEEGLVPDGIVGKRTWPVLFPGDRFPGVTISDALRHPPTNIMWAAEVLTYCRNVLGRSEIGVMLACYYSGANGQVTRYLREVFDRIDKLSGVTNAKN